jgi:hypothetical protein
MNWEFYPSYKEINSDIFFNLFNIKFLLIYESELVNIKTVSNSFTIIKNETFNNKKILLLKKKNSKHVLLRNVITKKTCELSDALLNCIELLKNNFDLINSNNINLFRIEDSNYIVKNNSNNKINYVFPFFNDKNWHIDNKLFVENNFFITVEIQPHASINIKHKNNIFKYQKITSFIFLFILVLLIIFKSSKKKIKYL